MRTVPYGVESSHLLPAIGSLVSTVIRNKKIHLANRSIKGHWNVATTNHIIALFLKIPTEPKLRLWWGYRS